MFKLPQTRRMMTVIAIIEAIALFLSLIVAPDFFVIFLIAGIIIWGAVALMLKIFEWICFGSDD